MTGLRLTLAPIGVLRSPFTDKFGIPRQPRLVPAATARVQLLPPYDRAEAFAGLDGFSHVWLLFVFHQDCLDAPWRPMVRPPRLGGRDKVGVFASRAPYRPNPIGISAVAQHGLVQDAAGLGLLVSGVDLLDGTPILDIKPYLPYADRISEASAGFAPPPAMRLGPIRFSPTAEQALAEHDPHGRRQLRALIAQVIGQDPRPGYLERYPERQCFALRLYDLDIHWRLDDPMAGTAARSGVEVTAVLKLPDDGRPPAPAATDIG